MSVTALKESDFASWATLLRRYHEFNKMDVSESENQKTFSRILSNNGDLYALVIRDHQDATKLLGLSHYITYSNTTGKRFCQMNGMLLGAKF